MINTYQPRTMAKDNATGIKCVNGSGEEMPAYSAMMVDSETDGIVTVKKPVSYTHLTLPTKRIV